MKQDLKVVYCPPQKLPDQEYQVKLTDTPFGSLEIKGKKTNQMFTGVFSFETAEGAKGFAKCLEGLGWQYSLHPIKEYKTLSQIVNGEKIK